MLRWPSSQSNIRGCILSVIAALFLFGLENNAIAVPDKPTAVISRAAPDFSRTDLNQGQVSLRAYRGKVVLLNFWATWCSPCLIEVPHFVVWQQAYGKRGLQVIGVSMDDDAQLARAAYHRYRLNYPVVMGDEKLGEIYGGIFGLPVTFLIDRRGRIRFTHKSGARLSQIRSEMEKLLLEH
jgi:cytochrome c biogenesis protein CcmG, thiol:disulfide interchange protein DsbE